MENYIKSYLIPIAAFLLFIAIYLGYSETKNNDFIYLPVWDIDHYLSISRTGYEVFPCDPQRHYPVGDICGNVGWYPMWPIIIAVFRPVFGGSTRITYLFLTYLFSFLSILLFYRFIKDHYDTKVAAIGLLALIFGPASFYYLTGFPYALFAFLFMLYIIYLYRPAGTAREIILAGTGLAISLTYPTGILVTIIPFVWFLAEQKQYKEGWKNRVYWLKLAKYVLPFVLGPLLLWLYFYFKFDDFFLQFHFQEKYNRTWAFPLTVIIKSLVNNPLLSPENAIIIWFGLAFILFSGRRIKKELWITGLALLLFSPSTGTMMSLYRHYLLIFPAYMMVGVANRPMWLKLLFIAFGVYLSLSLFFPEYISGQLI